MAFKNMKELEQGISAAGQNWSDADKALAKKDISYGNSLYTLKNDWVNATKRGDTAAAKAIHDRTEDFRKQYGGYSGGADGSGYIRDDSYFRYDDPYQDTLEQLADSLVNYSPFENPYQQQTDKVLSEYLGRGPFSYDLDSDPIWQQYQKTYLREGQRAREDTLGDYAAATGGQSSTAAVYAASQAQDYYNAKMADKVPELYGLAYDMWLNEGQQYASQLNTLRGLGSDALNAWDANRGLLHDQLAGVQELSRSMYDRAYKNWAADYQVNRDSLMDTRYREETDYLRARDADETAYLRAQDEAQSAASTQQQALKQALEWLKMGVNPSDDVTNAAGLTSGEIESYLAAVQAKQAGNKSSSGSGGRRSSGSSASSGSSGSAGAGTVQDYAGLFRDAYNSGHPENFIASNYKKYGFSKSTGLSKEYHAAYNEDFDAILDTTRNMIDVSEYSPSAARAHLRAKGYDADTIEQIMGAL